MIKIAIVGTGGMANGHAAAFKAIGGCKVTAACDVIREKAEAFAEKHGIKKVYDNVDDLLADGDFDAVSNVTPDAHHAPVSLKVIAKKKHILCEKPLATHYADARKMAQAAKRKGVINMVNFSYRNSSAIQRAHDLVAAGELGEIMHFEASYLQGWLVWSRAGNWNPGPGALWRLSEKHGSKGVLGDLGVHIVDFATFPSGEVKSLNCHLKTFEKVKGNRIGEYVFDANDTAVMTVELRNGAVGTIHTTRWGSGHGNSLRLEVHGDRGALLVDLDKGWDTLQICRGKDLAKLQWRTLKCGKTPNIYQRFVKSIKTGVNDQPDFERGAAIQKVLDACYESDHSGKDVKV